MIGLKNYYWFFKSALHKKTCEEIISIGNFHTRQKGIVQGEEQGKTSDASSIRNSTVKWLEDPWIYDQVLPYIRTANQNAGWNFDWDRSETMQLTHYRPGEFYSWHSDDYNEPFGESKHANYRGKIRKLSVTVNLSDPSSYTGGEFELDLRNNPSGRNIITVDEAAEQGTILVFPSFVTHQIRPVRSGERMSLVLWNLGPPWK